MIPPSERRTYQEASSTDIPLCHERLLQFPNSTDIPREEYYESATARREITAGPHPILGTLCAAAKGQYFEDGMDSPFSIDLIRIIKQYGDYAINELAYLILREMVDDEVASEALRQLGHMNHPASYHSRRWLLEKSLLACSSAMVRDGALLGIVLLDDRHTIPYVQRALQQEQCQELYESIQQVLEQLENAY